MAFASAGLPEGVVQNLFLSHEDTERIVKSGQMDFICFTGSVPAGQRIQRAAAEHICRCSSGIRWQGSSLRKRRCQLRQRGGESGRWRFFNSGQSCCGIERIYVHESLFDTFVEAYVERVKQYRLANPLQPGTTLGPVVKTSAADWVRQQVREAVSEGASACIDRGLFPAAAADNTPYLAPQVLTGVNHNMSVMTAESFGPVVGIMPVATDEETIR